VPHAVLVFVPTADFDSRRRAELASFLRSRRERVRPVDVGLAPGPRRRTPGLRREEVAQLAGVGVTWYTWLEQGRPINASTQVLDAVARVLRLGNAERWHLYRLAEVPGVPAGSADESVPEHVLPVLDAFDGTPAALYNGKYDVLACNDAYGALFPHLLGADGIRRNALWQIYAGTGGGTPITDEDVCASMISTMRANYANHLGDPAWEELIEALCAASADFAAKWAAHPIADPGPPVTKAFTIWGVGTVRVRGTGFPVPGTAECRMVVYVPHTAADAALIMSLRDRAARRTQPA
jgi:hypothetical protein